MISWKHNFYFIKEDCWFQLVFPWKFLFSIISLSRDNNSVIIKRGQRQSPVIEHMDNMEEVLSLIQELYELWGSVQSSAIIEPKTYRVGETHLGWKHCWRKKEEVIQHQYWVRTPVSPSPYNLPSLTWILMPLSLNFAGL